MWPCGPVVGVGLMSCGWLGLCSCGYGRVTYAWLWRCGSVVSYGLWAG